MASSTVRDEVETGRGHDARDRLQRSDQHSPSPPTQPVVTTSVTVVVPVSVPLVPVIVTTKLPVGVVADVVTDMVDVAVAGFGANVAPAPLGRPVALKLTAPVNPPEAVTVMV
jgi:hypothetical protein